MQALVFNEPEGRLELLHNHPQPVPKANEALIKVLIAGICSTVSTSLRFDSLDP